jgi:hypothetical protein
MLFSTRVPYLSLVILFTSRLECQAVEPTEPIEKVDGSLHTAEEFVITTSEKANEENRALANLMMQAVMEQDPNKLTVDSITALNDAIKLKGAAKEIKVMVNSHKMGILEFIRLIQAFKQKDKERDIARSTLEEEHRVAEEANQAQHEALIADLEQELQSLLCTQYAGELKNIKTLLGLHDTMKTESGAIEEKDEDKNIHPHVAEGLVAIGEWGNKELFDVCATYVPSAGVLQFPKLEAIVSDAVKGMDGGVDGLLTDQSKCQTAVLALVQHFETMADKSTLEQCGPVRFADDEETTTPVTDALVIDKPHTPTELEEESPCPKNVLWTGTEGSQECLGQNYGETVDRKCCDSLSATSEVKLERS